MNQLKLYKVLTTIYEKEKAQEFIDAMAEDNSAVTKQDLKELELKVMQEFKQVNVELVKVYKEINAQTWKFLGGLALIATIFKLADFFLQHGTRS